nr:T9SS type A sorting domain-containing protein [uncultured Fluviicola sp.]
MEQKLLSLILFGNLCFYSFSQQNTTASGGNATGSGGSVSYSIGQVDYINSSASTGNFNQGVQQVYEIGATSGISELSSLITALFPNPTSGVLSLEISPSDEELSYQLVDLAGRVLTSSNIQVAQTSIDLSSFASGEYLLNISSKNTCIKTIKIVKH